MEVKSINQCNMPISNEMTTQSDKKILVLGGTGAMGMYLVPELASMEFQVDVVSLDRVENSHPNIRYIQADAKDDTYLRQLLENQYDAIVDFMLYSTKAFIDRYELLLANTQHYIFLSTYRVYADSVTAITENSFRLLDVAEDKEFLAFEDYSLYKARQENILRYSKFKNWTIIRPAITYSKRRFQLVTLEADVVICRAINKKTVVLPQEAMRIQATMSWAGDVAKLMSRLVLNPVALQEIYTLSTAEHHTWEEVANYYKELIGLNYVLVGTETYLSLFGEAAAKHGARYQLLYDRCFNRVMDNTKVLLATGMKQSDFTSLKDGLMKELSALPEDAVWEENPVNENMDAIV